MPVAHEAPRYTGARLSGCLGALALLLCSCGAAEDPQGQDPGDEQGQAGSSGSGGGLVTSGGGATSAGGSSNGGSSAGVSGMSMTAGSGGSHAGSGNAGGAGTLVLDAGPFVPPKCATGSSTALPANAPKLTLGTFVKISPPNVPFDSKATAITQGMTIDPCNPATVYVCVGDVESGIYRSTDGGATWRELGDFKFPVNIRVDPKDPLHLYVGDGVRGGANGFFVSKDGGATWTIPQSFKDFVTAGGVYDVYHVEPDPTDFNHVLVTFHSPWKDMDSGVLESMNGGDTWIKHGPVDSGAFAGGYDVYFLFEPKLGIGDNKTWLFGTQGKGHFRTVDSGTTWTKVTDINMQHGGGTVYYTKAGVLYMSSASGVLKSTDNGKTFTNVKSGAYLSVIGDGTRLYTGQHFNSRFVTALESADTAWTEFNTQDFDEGPFQMSVDSTNGILYSANIRTGVFALKVK